jgi:hypothetical protein
MSKACWRPCGGPTVGRRRRARGSLSAGARAREMAGGRGHRFGWPRWPECTSMTAGPPTESS